MIGKRMTGMICAIGILAVLGGQAAADTVQTTPTAQTTADAMPAEQTDMAASAAYEDVYLQAVQAPRPFVSSSIVSQNGSAPLQEYDGQSGFALQNVGDWGEWQLEVPQSGAYTLVVEYYPLEGTGMDIEVGISVDGRVPFEEAATVTLPRIWADQADEQGQTIGQDSVGNDLRPAQVEKPRWVKRALADSQGLYDQPYLLMVEEGVHTVRLTLGREALAVAAVRLENTETLTYEEYRAQQSGTEIYTGETIRQEAELPLEKTSSMLYAVTDRSNAATLPSDPYNVRLNTIGQSNWSGVGQAITWKVDVPQAGWYRVGFRARQNYNPGMTSYRNLYINGTLPFEEAENVAFPYASDWYNVVLGEEEPLTVYLRPGDTLTLECSPGPMSDVLRRIQQTVLELGEIYRKIIVVTGVNPDVYRDYQLEREIPGLLEWMTVQRDALQGIADDILAVTGKSSTQTATINQAALILDDFIQNSLTITERLASFKGQIENISSLLLSFSQQPLELDCLYFMPADGQPPRAMPSLGQSVSYGVQKFLASFFNDYNTMTLDSGSDTLNVWVATGRDQTQIINTMIGDAFTAQTGIGVNLSLVDTGTTLIQATLAGKGPDVALTVNAGDVINFAMRGALADLSRYGVENLYDQFYDSAWTPFRYNGGVYAVPETQTFQMLFYRKDIFEELGLKPPDTWTDFYHVLQTLQNNNLVVGVNEIDSTNQGVSAGISIFDMFLFQRGGTYYNDTLTATRFDSTEAYEAFEEWAALYDEYGLPRQVDFFNRFRTGEMPMGITNYTLYNQLMSSAPELRGLWAMTPVPGTSQNDVVDRSLSSGGAGAMMLAKAEKRGVGEAAADFLFWWAGAETQARYGREQEAILGVAARYAPANREAFEQLGWTEAEAETIRDQWQWVRNMPPVPGNYMLARSLTNALRSSLETGEEPRRSLYIYNRDINAEITRKRAEFKLD